MSNSRKLMTVGGGGGSYVDDVFSTYLYTGTSAAQEIVNGIDLADKGGMVWVKNRGAVADHALVHSEASNEYLSSNNNLNSVGPIGYPFVDPTATGFTVNIDGGSSLVSFNTNGNDYASWTFAKQEGFFDVVTWTGDNVAGREIPHSLGGSVGMSIVKRTDAAGPWTVNHIDLPDHYLSLESTDSAQSDVKMVSTDSTISWTGSNVYYNRTGSEYVAYLFADDAPMFGPNSDESIIKCGSYTGNGSADGPEIDLGFEPQWLLIKSVDAADNWYMFDTMRGMATGGDDVRLFANSSTSEDSASWLDVTSTGFKIKTTVGAFNDNARDYIYMAIRRPNKPAEEFEPEELFATDNAGPADPFQLYSGFPVDMAWNKYTGGSDANYLSARLLQDNKLVTNSTSASAVDAAYSFDFMEGWYDGAQGTGTHSWMFRRAPGFFDVVTYEGNGVAGREVPHGLAAVPEMLWLKRLNDTSNWSVWSKSIGVDRCLYLNLHLPHQGQSAFNDTAPTDTVFTVETDASCNAAGSDYIAYLWASTPGLCDIGTYTANGDVQDIDCGFTNGARFVLIKRTDDYGDWMYFDTVRGIVDDSGVNHLGHNGTDPYLTLNTSSGEVINKNWLNPLAAGFTLKSVMSDSPGTGLINLTGAEYIYMAIA